MPNVEILFCYPRRKIEGELKYKHVVKTKSFLITKYVFEVYGDNLYVQSYKYSGKKSDECLIKNFLSVSANKLMHMLGKDDVMSIYKNTPLYDGLLKTYKDNGGSLGFSIPILRDAI